MTFLRIAWRNLWKRKRLTAILLLGIATGVFTLLFHQALMEGFFVLMVDSAVDMSLGHLQVHRKDYLLRKDIALVIPGAPALTEEIRRLPSVTGAAQRLLCYGLASSADSSHFAKICGIDPAAEMKVTTIDTFLVEGKRLEPGDTKGAFIGKALAGKLKIGVGDKMVVMARTRDGDMSGAAFRVRGLYHTASGDFDKMNVYVTVDGARAMVGAGADEANEIAVRVSAPDRIPAVLAQVRGLIGGRSLTAQPWQELAPIVSQTIEISRQYMELVFLLVFIAVAFGIVNAFYMEIFERIREFGIMMCLGTRPAQIFTTLAWEALLLGLFGSLAGTAACVTLVCAVMKNRLDYGMFSSALQFMGLRSVQPLIIVPESVAYCCAGAILTALVATVLPALKAARFKPVDALRHV